MAFNNRFNQNAPKAKQINCSCGGKSKLFSRKNYPFGKKSSSVETKGYKCVSCNKTTLLDPEQKNKRR